MRNISILFHFNYNSNIGALRAPEIYTLRVRTLAFGLKMEIKCLLFLFRPTVILVVILIFFLSNRRTDEYILFGSGHPYRFSTHLSATF